MVVGILNGAVGCVLLCVNLKRYKYITIVKYYTEGAEDSGPKVSPCRNIMQKGKETSVYKPIPCWVCERQDLLLSFDEAHMGKTHFNVTIHWKVTTYSRGKVESPKINTSPNLKFLNICQQRLRGITFNLSVVSSTPLHLDRKLQFIRRAC